jgi:hypothetical protein
MVIHGIFILFPAIGLNDFHRYVDDLNSIEIIDLIIPAYLSMS